MDAGWITTKTVAAFACGAFIGTCVAALVMSLCRIASEHRRIVRDIEEGRAFRVPTREEWELAGKRMGEMLKGGKP